MGSQVRILYRPPSKDQVRGLEPLTFFIFETKSDSKNKFVLSESLFLARVYARLPDEVFDAAV